jgi:hypothetical protein
MLNLTSSRESEIRIHGGEHSFPGQKLSANSQISHCEGNVQVTFGCPSRHADSAIGLVPGFYRTDAKNKVAYIATGS